MDVIWIIASIFAAACQTARSAFQKNMIPQLGDYGAAYIRFCYALPFTISIWVVWINFPGNSIPDLSTYSITLCFLGSIFQVLFTYVLLKVFSHRSYNFRSCFFFPLDFGNLPRCDICLIFIFCKKGRDHIRYP